MNQLGFVEISLVKKDQVYRVLLPLGVPWSDAYEALLEVATQIAEHVKSAQEEMDREKVDESQELNQIEGA